MERKPNIEQSRITAQMCLLRIMQKKPIRAYICLVCTMLLRMNQAERDYVVKFINELNKKNLKKASPVEVMLRGGVPGRN